jgi:hypothetical protein
MKENEGLPRDTHLKFKSSSADSLDEGGGIETIIIDLSNDSRTAAYNIGDLVLGIEVMRLVKEFSCR